MMAQSRGMRYNPPPNWPTPPPGWTPQPGWEPDPAWGPEPPGWALWTPEPSDNPPPIATDPEVTTSTRLPNPAYEAGPYESPPAYANPPAAPSPPQYGYGYPPPAPTYGAGFPSPYAQPPYGRPPRRNGVVWAVVGLVAVVGVVLAVVLVTTTGVIGPSDEEAIRQTVSAMETAYNDADPTTFRALICDDKRSDFSDDAEDMEQTLEFGGEITLDVDTVYVNGERATAEVSGEIFGENFDETWRFVLEDDAWLWCGE